MKSENNIETTAGSDCPAASFAAPQTPINERIMNDTNETPRVRQVVVERVTTKREDILVNAGTPSEAFEAAKNGGVVLTESETEEYIIRDYPEDH